MFGGMSSTRNNELYFYQLKKNTWNIIETKGDLPSPRCYCSGFLFKNKIIIYGGQGDKNRSIGDVCIIDLETNIWRKCSVLQPPKSRV